MREEGIEKDFGGANYAFIEGLNYEGYFAAEEMELLRLAAVGPSWPITEFEDNLLNIRRAYETRIFYADTTKRPLVFELIGYNAKIGETASISSQPLLGLSDIIPKDESPELGRLIKLVDGKIEYGPVVEGNIIGLGMDLEGWPVRELELAVNFKDQRSITETVGEAHSHPNYKYAWEILRRQGLVTEQFPEGSRTYSSIPSLPDLIAHVVEPELIFGVIVSADRSATLIVRPDKYLEHFKRFLGISQQEMASFSERNNKAFLSNNDLGSKTLAKEFADAVGLELFSGRITENNTFVLEE